MILTSTTGNTPINDIDDLERFASELSEQIKQMDFRAKNGGAAIAYSDRLNSDNNVFSALFLTAQDISESSDGNYSFINDAAENILNDESFQKVLREKIGQPPMSRIMGGDWSGSHQRVKYSYGQVLSLNDLISREYMTANARGDVPVIVGFNAPNVNVLAQTELPTLIHELPDVTHINGIPVEDLRSLSPNDSFEAVKRASLRMQEHAPVYRIQGENPDQKPIELMDLSQSHYGSKMKFVPKEGYQLVGVEGERIINHYVDGDYYRSLSQDQQTVIRNAIFQREADLDGPLSQYTVALNTEGKIVAMVGSDGQGLSNDSYKVRLDRFAQFSDDSIYRSKVAGYNDLPLSEKMALKEADFIDKYVYEGNFSKLPMDQQKYLRNAVFKQSSAIDTDLRNYQVTLNDHNKVTDIKPVTPTAPIAERTTTLEHFSNFRSDAEMKALYDGFDKLDASERFKAKTLDANLVNFYKHLDSAPASSKAIALYTAGSGTKVTDFNKVDNFIVNLGEKIIQRQAGKPKVEFDLDGSFKPGIPPVKKGFDLEFNIGRSADLRQSLDGLKGLGLKTLSYADTALDALEVAEAVWDVGTDLYYGNYDEAGYDLVRNTVKLGVTHIGGRALSGLAMPYVTGFISVLTLGNPIAVIGGAILVGYVSYQISGATGEHVANFIDQNVRKFFSDPSVETVTELVGEGGKTLVGTEKGDQIIATDDTHTLIGWYGNDQLVGNKRANIIHGNEGDDYLDGKGGDDDLYGGDGKDTILGGDGRDKLYGNREDDRMNGNAGADKLYGQEGDDELHGEKGNDLLDGGIGNDLMDGGDGKDTFIYKRGYGDDRIFDNVDDNLVKLSDLSAEDIEGTITKKGEAALRVKSDGGHVIFLNFRSDKDSRRFTLEYGDGTQIHLEDDLETPFRNLVGTDENDHFRAFLDNTTIHGKAGDDTLSSRMKNTVLYGEDGNDILKTEADGVNKLYGGAGNDKLQVSYGNNFLDGGLGDDLLHGGYGDDTYLFQKGHGVDLVHDSYGLTRLKFLDQTKASDYQLYYWGDNGITLKNYETADELRFQYFRWHVDYRNLVLEFSDGSVMRPEDEGSLFKTIHGTAENDKLSAIYENSTLLGYEGSDTLNGSSGNDVLKGGKGDDLLNAGRGNDILDGGIGNDRLEGDFGDDTYLFQKGHGVDLVHDSYGLTRLKFLDQTKASDYQLYYWGDNGITLKNHETADELRFQYFRWHVDYRNLVLEFSDGSVMRPEDEGSLFKTIHGTAENDKLSAIYENSTLLGYEGSDTLNGSSGNDVLKGGKGDDLLNAGRGNDILDGGIGNDRLEGDSGDDTYLFQKGHGVDLVHDSYGLTRLKFLDQTKASDYQLYYWGDNGITLKNHETADELRFQYFRWHSDYRKLILEFSDGSVMRPEDEGSLFKTIHGTAENDKLSAIYENSTLLGYEGSDTLNGSSGNDVLKGGKGDDLLNAGRGNDILDGGIGNDRLEGDFGDDTYLFNRGDGQDRVYDTVGQNVLHFGEKILPEQLKLTKVNNDLSIDYHETDRVTLSSYFYGSSYQQFSLAFANKHTATIDAANLTLNITPAPAEEKVEEASVSKTVLTPEVTANQVIPTETVKTEIPSPVEGEVAVQSVPVETSHSTTETDKDKTDEEASNLSSTLPGQVEWVTSDGRHVIISSAPEVPKELLDRQKQTANTGETMAYIAQPLPNVTNQVVGQ